MLDINHIIKIFSELGSFLGQFDENGTRDHHLNNAFYDRMKNAMALAKTKNGWFTEESVSKAFLAWSESLTEKNLKEWVQQYPNFTLPKTPKRIAVIMAGNIPLVGFHDFLTVLISGNSIVAKMSSDDEQLFPVIKDIIVELHPEFANRIELVRKIVKPDAVIATGSDNSARYFEAYFSKYPHLIRKNRTSIAVLSGDETEEEMAALGEDIFTYYGMGCRNVSKLFVQEGFDLNRIFSQLVTFGEIGNHHKYHNNYQYYRTIYMLNKIKFLENGFVIFKVDESLHTPISVVHYEYYRNPNELEEKLDLLKNEIQCLVGKGEGHIPFGKAQNPALWDYADGVDTLNFLQKLTG